MYLLVAVYFCGYFLILYIFYTAFIVYIIFIIFILTDRGIMIILYLFLITFNNFFNIYDRIFFLLLTLWIIPTNHCWTSSKYILIPYLFNFNIITEFPKINLKPNFDQTDLNICSYIENYFKYLPSILHNDIIIINNNLNYFSIFLFGNDFNRNNFNLNKK